MHKKQILIVLAVIAIIGILATIGFIALTSSQEEAVIDPVKVSDLQSVRAAIAISFISENAFPASPAACTTGATNPLAIALSGRVEGIDWDNIFYCSNTAGRDIAGNAVANKEANTEYVIGTTLKDTAHIALLNDYDGAVYIGSAANATQCAGANLCITGSK